jgi:hypothetical protein
LKGGLVVCALYTSPRPRARAPELLAIVESDAAQTLALVVAPLARTMPVPLI